MNLTQATIEKFFKRALAAVPVLTLAFGLVGANEAQAVTRPIFVAGTAILIMEGFSASGGADPQPKELYDSMAMEPIQTSGGWAKLIKTETKDFSLTCGTKGNGVVCNIAVKSSARTRIDSATQSAEVIIEGAEAQDFYTKLAGANSQQAYVHVTRDQWIRIESTPERFMFQFKQR